ncbi:MAG: tetratricopeptide repeat protein [Candidatus Gastranaerophilales bacterium]|nr:tetratricopeptide repeat protein [Candidatus Gastranaerophilales bacterium]
MKKKIMLSALVLLLSLNSTFTCDAAVNLEKNIAQINSSIQKANYKGADEVIYRTLTEYKDNYEVQALAAVSWALQSKLELAQDQIDRLKNIIPKSSDLHFAQGVVFYKRITSSNMAYRTKIESLLDIAEREFRYSIQLDPLNYRAYNALGVIELKKGDAASAKQNIETALDLCPEYAIAIDNLGTVYLAQGDTSKAESYFKKAISMNPNSHAAYYHMAQLEFSKGSYDKCLTYLNKCLAWQGYSSYAYNLRGDAFRLQGNEAAAISAYKKAIEITPENLAPYANLAAIYEARCDYDLALDAYKTILSINPDSEQTLLKVADIYLETGKYSEAVGFYDKLNSHLKTEGIKGMASAYYGMAMNMANKATFSSDKRLLDAYSYLDKAIQANPDDLELYLAKAKISSLINRQADSVENLNEIVQRPGCKLDDFLVKGDAYTALGNYKAAAAEYNSAVNAAKTIDDKLFLGEIFTFNKQFDEATLVFNDLMRYDHSNVIARNNIAYINKSRDYANIQVKNAKYFRIRNSMFFEREYLNKALKADPYSVDANILMGRLNQRQRKYVPAYNCYAIVVAKSKDYSTIEQYTKRLNKMKKKIDKQCQKAAGQTAKEKQKAVKSIQKEKIVPVNDVKSQNSKVKKEKTTKSKSTKTKNTKKSSSGSTVDYSPKSF